MITARKRPGAVLRWSGLWATFWLTAPLVAAPPLRYQLDVGDRLVYERRVRVTALAGDAVLDRYSQQLQLWCLSREQDEVLVLGELARVVDQQPGPARGVLLHLGLRGQRRFPPEVLARVSELDALFEPLPILPPVLEAQHAWLSDPDHFGRRWRCTYAGSDASHDDLARVDVVLEDPSGVAEACGVTERGLYEFDTQVGVVVRAESEWRDRSSGRRTLAVMRLHTRLKEQPLWCQQRAIEADRFLSTLRVEDRLLERITTTPDEVEALLARIDRMWSELAEGIPSETRSPFRRLAEGQRALLAEKTDSFRERARLARQWLGSSAAQWSLQTPDGKTIRSETVRDRIVVECFWSADSLPSLRSFELLRQMQAQLPPDGFRIVCLNIDADVSAARQAIRLCGSGLTQVLAGPPVGGWPPHELPVIRVLNRHSNVLAVYFGWQPALAEKISQLPR